MLVCLIVLIANNQGFKVEQVKGWACSQTRGKNTNQIGRGRV